MNRSWTALFLGIAAFVVVIAVVRWTVTEEMPADLIQRPRPSENLPSRYPPGAARHESREKGDRPARQLDADPSRKAALQALVRKRGQHRRDLLQAVRRAPQGAALPREVPPAVPKSPELQIGSADFDFPTIRAIAFRSPDPDERILATELLPDIDSKAAVLALAGVAKGDPEPAVRVAAIEALSDIEDIEYLPPLRLIDTMLDDPEAEVRLAALEFLAELDIESLWPLIDKGLQDADEEVRAMAEALANTQ